MIEQSLREPCFDLMSNSQETWFHPKDAKRRKARKDLFISDFS
jgi:hypothetical protein